MWKRIAVILFIIYTLTIPVFASWKRVDIDSHFPDVTFVIWTDEEYGTQYVVCRWDGEGVGICPRYTDSGAIVKMKGK